MVLLQPSLQGPTDLQPREGRGSPITFLDYELRKKTWAVTYDAIITLSNGTTMSSLALTSTPVLLKYIV